jgi:hypothetical protein
LLPRDTPRHLLAARIASARRGAESRQSCREVLASPTSIGNEPRINFGMTVIDPSLGGLFLRRLCRSTPRLVFNRRFGYSSPSATADKTVDPRNAKLLHDMGAGLVPDYHAQNRPAGDKAAPTRLARIAGAL